MLSKFMQRLQFSTSLAYLPSKAKQQERKELLFYRNKRRFLFTRTGAENTKIELDGEK